MSRLARDLFSMSKLLILLSKSVEFLMCELLIVLQRGNNILAKDFVMLWKAVPIPEIIGHKRIPGFMSFKKTITVESSIISSHSTIKQRIGIFSLSPYLVRLVLKSYKIFIYT